LADPRRFRAVRRFVRSPTAVAGLLLVGGVAALGVFSSVIAPGAAFEFGFPSIAPPSRDHLLGTDAFARDMLVLTTQGIRTTLTVVVVVMAVSLPLGAALGLTAGYAGGLVDSVVTRVAEFFQSVPRFFLALAVIAVYGPGIDKLILLLCATSWPFLCRTLRAETLSVKERGFVVAARAAGARAPHIVVRHVLPHVMPRALVVVMLMGSRLILIEAGLAFLGLGDRSDPSLGVLASEAQPYLRDAWWLSVFPGVTIVLLVLGLNLLSDGLSRALEVETDIRAVAKGWSVPGAPATPASATPPPQGDETPGTSPGAPGVRPLGPRET
jgi:peptide/nickel transport system permease protein